jgi:hypothetical protein
VDGEAGKVLEEKGVKAKVLLLKTSASMNEFYSYLYRRYAIKQ